MMTSSFSVWRKMVVLDNGLNSNVLLHGGVIGKLGLSLCSVGTEIRR